jgi:hypothetical protein
MPVKTETAATPKSLALTATAVIDVDAAASGDGATALPRFRMVAYTGGPMRVAGWRHPVIVDLAGLAIPSFRSRPASGCGSHRFHPNRAGTTRRRGGRLARYPGRS